MGGEDADGSNLHYVAPLMTAKKHAKFVKNNEVALVGFFRKDNDMHHKIFGEAVWSLHQAIDRDDVGAGIAAVTLQSVAKKAQAQVPSVVAYLDGKAIEQDGVFAPEKWSAKALADFAKQFLPLGAADGEEDVGEKDEL